MEDAELIQVYAGLAMLGLLASRDRGQQIDILVGQPDPAIAPRAIAYARALVRALNEPAAPEHGT